MSRLANTAQTRKSSWFSLIPSFPDFTGPYDVGITDFEWDGAFHDDKDELIQTHETESLLVKFYYPCEKPVHGGEHPKKKPTWLPSWVYGQGYADFVGLPKIIAYPISAYISLISLPGWVSAPLATPKHTSPIDKYPVIIFSHGLGGNRTTYSYLLGDLASYGFVVAAVEHRDKSASTSLMKGNRVPFHRAPVVGLGEPEYPFRNAQVRHRSHEVLKTVELIKRLNDGHAPENHFDSISKPKIPGFPFNEFKNKLDVNSMSLMGHSFGGATVIQTLLKHSQHFRAGFVFDPWCFPVTANPPFSRFIVPSTTNSSENREMQIPKLSIPIPVLYINSETFHWADNVRAMWKLWNGDENSKNKNELVTIIGTAHQSPSDFPLLFPTLLRKSKMGGTQDTYLSILLHRRLSLSFLSRFIDVPFGNEHDKLLTPPPGEEPANEKGKGKEAEIDEELWNDVCLVKGFDYYKEFLGISLD